ncbi:hypothetical protein PU683_05780 [Kosakonia cowanii]|uniref:hypothetical protein n=1 Tax=Kosakonia cowanii TaxID=208223 RepID=UPI0023F9C618|nr:hypothetical protein [Kosakonia cowanii]MDF7759040.1 hypothetical protein [Kosakonia cowanii]
MRDIYHQLVKQAPDFRGHSDEDLSESSDVYGAGVFAITSVLTLIGNLTLDAVQSEDYSDEDARRDLVLVGDALRHLPRLAQALEQNSTTASYVLSKRRGEAQS